MAAESLAESPRVSTEHIYIDEHGNARLIGRRTKVYQIALDKLSHGWSADEIQANYPHLTLAEIHAALAYYYDHQQELDALIAQYEREFEEAWRQQQADPKHQAFVAELRRRGGRS